LLNKNIKPYLPQPFLEVGEENEKYTNTGSKDTRSGFAE
jgi:hypothetical protein